MTSRGLYVEELRQCLHGAPIPNAKRLKHSQNYYSISITSNMRPTDERGRPMHGRPHAHPVGP